MTTEVSPEEARKLWVEALRSGKYNQTKNVLRDIDDQGVPTAYCCLGVACEVYVETTGRGRWIPDSSVFSAGDSFEQSTTIMLPPIVQNWLGLATTAGAFDEGGNTLIEVNDGGSTFDEIADIIENKPDLLSPSSAKYTPPPNFPN